MNSCLNGWTTGSIFLYALLNKVWIWTILYSVNNVLIRKNAQPGGWVKVLLLLHYVTGWVVADPFLYHSFAFNLETMNLPKSSKWWWLGTSWLCFSPFHVVWSIFFFSINKIKEPRSSLRANDLESVVCVAVPMLTLILSSLLIQSASLVFHDIRRWGWANMTLCKATWVSF